MMSTLEPAPNVARSEAGAKPEMKLNVTQRDIDLGERESPDRCPIARAVRRHRGFGGMCVSSVFLYYGPEYPVDYRWHMAAELPREVQNFIGRFDADLPVEPTVFDLWVGPVR